MEMKDRFMWRKLSQGEIIQCASLDRSSSFRIDMIINIELLGKIVREMGIDIHDS